MAFGLTLTSRVLLVVVFAIPMLIVNARAGVRQVDPALIEMSTSFMASERKIWRRVLLPGALPAIMTGVRLGVGRAITGMVIIELLLFAVGIGNLIINARGEFDGPTLYGVVILIVIESLILISIARWLERRVGALGDRVGPGRLRGLEVDRDRRRQQAFPGKARIRSPSSPSRIST